MTKQKPASQKGLQQPTATPRTFASEQEEAAWWASSAGRTFLGKQTAHGKKGSKLVATLAKTNTVQIALRLPSPDLAKARVLAEQKGIGYQTLLKMLVHEGLQRVEAQAHK
jgi:hypothetical protein